MLEGGSLYLFHAPPKGRPIEVDIVFVHGLWPENVTSTPWMDNWTSDKIGEDGKPELTDDGRPVPCARAWPDELLSQDLPNARMLSFAYETAALRRNGWDIGPVASTLLDDLRAAGVGSERPVVFVGHSMGGLIVKAACQQLSGPWAWPGGSPAEPKKADERFLNKIKGFAFYATPHKIFHLDKWLEVMNGGKKASFLRVMLTHILLGSLHSNFLRQCRRYGWEKFAFCETYSTSLAVSKRPLNTHAPHRHTIVEACRSIMLILNYSRLPVPEYPSPEAYLGVFRGPRADAGPIAASWWWWQGEPTSIKWVSKESESAAQGMGTSLKWVPEALAADGKGHEKHYEPDITHTTTHSPCINAHIHILVPITLLFLFLLRYRRHLHGRGGPPHGVQAGG